jgi:rhodanese-related sulfurtransferase
LPKENYEFNTGRLDLQLRADANAVILDVRTDDEMQCNHENAITMIYIKVKASLLPIEQLDKTKNYYVLSFWCSVRKSPANC